MGWADYHLHEFKILNTKTMINVLTGIPDEENESARAEKPGWKIPIANYFTMENRNAACMYDFGDGWKHNIRLEKIEPANPDLKYPCCLDGARACPPEDVGGNIGYENFLDSIKDPDDDQHEQLLEWIGGSFDPEHFDPDEVCFDDPEERWKEAFEEDDDA
jgi:hypothetical protein